MISLIRHYMPRLILIGFAGFISAMVILSDSYAAGLFTQIVLPFDTTRPYEYTYEKAENALILALQKTSPQELNAIEHYDERLIRRVLIKDLGPSGTEIKLVLKNRGVRAVVSHFNEPFRVVVELFDADYTEPRDPLTGIPIASTSTPEKTEAGEISAPGSLLLSETNPHAAAPETTPIADGKTPRRLLQPTPKLLSTPGELNEVMRKAPEGRGKAWSEFPPYVYRLQTAAYEAGMKRQTSPKDSELALSSAEAMAQYAGKLFDLGDESRALVAYQQVLYKEPSIFDKDALHLWKFAETQFGQGNLSLARGYFEALVEKHPESPLAGFAKLRVLDVAAVQLLRHEQPEKQAQLLDRLSLIKTGHQGELSAQIAIRKAYWDPNATKAPYNIEHIPPVQASVRQELAAAYPTLENPRTAFIAGSLILKDLLKPSAPWQRATGQFAESYLKRSVPPRQEPYREQLRLGLYDKLNQTIQTKVAENQLLEATGDYEALPRSLHSIDREPRTAWALGEAYRKLGQQDKAMEHYRQAAKESGEGPERFKAQFWLGVTAGEAHALDRNGAGRRADLRTISRNADRDMEASWKRLSDNEKNTLLVAYKSFFEDAISSSSKLRTPAKIVLGIWKEKLQSRATATVGSDTTNTDANFSPSGATIVLLSNLSKRFAELGMNNEKREAQNLMQHLKPNELGDDKAARDLWRQQLSSLAEEYRSSSQYMEAGRLYALIGNETPNWEGRAETLYKGGLLLYRAGRRQEAMDAFRKAADDGNNLFYANLARERLSQLE